ncbi:MAG: aerobic C4-dicarboxylate transport protein [Alphaproteobacteria bacterium]|nr:aerobic C4-dicarboxylate transport protein [Alphaproteobacteria bacterium]
MKVVGALKLLYVQVLVATVLGIVVGLLFPETAVALKPLGDAFIRVVRMIIAPVVFCTVAIGIAHMSDLKKVGRVGGKTLLYFEIVSTLALIIGLVVGNVVRPGAGFNIDVATLDPNIAAQYTKGASSLSLTDHLVQIIPDTLFSPFVNGDLLQVLFIAILTGFACSRLGSFGTQVAHGLENGTRVLFSIIRIIVWAASVGSFGAMAFTIGRYGVASLGPLAILIATFYLTAFLFVVFVLGAIARLSGFSIFKFMKYIREELLIVLGTSSSEPVLPQLIIRMQKLGASRSVVGLVIPTGYSFNLDGTNIYMTLAILFLAQATNIDLTLWQQLEILAIAMLTSKGASGVTGAGFITLAATLTIVPTIPIASLALLVGIDRFMSQCRALTNAIGNGVATIVVARWENELDREQLARELASGPLEIGALGVTPELRPVPQSA